MLMRFDPYRDERANQSSGPPGVPRSLPMAMDAYRDGDQFVIYFDLPGVDPSSIDLTVEKDTLTAQAERGWKPAENQEVLINERPQGAFTRQLFLGDSLDTDHIAASYQDGVLKLTIPVAPQAKPRKVPVAAGNGHSQSIETTQGTTEARENATSAA